MNIEKNLKKKRAQKKKTFKKMFLPTLLFFSLCHALTNNQQNALLVLAPHRFNSSNIASACLSRWLTCNGEDPVILDMAKLKSATMPSEIGLFDTLEELRFGFGDIEQLPSEFGLLTNLLRIDSSVGKLKTIPSEIFLFSSLMSLWLPNMPSMTSSIPTQIGTLNAMTGLNLGSNQLSGDIPSQLGLLTGLKFLFLDHNFLGPIIPSEFVALTQLHQFRVHWNPLRGVFPNVTGDFGGTNMTRCDVDDVPSDPGTAIEYIAPCYTRCLSSFCCENVTIDACETTTEAIFTLSQTSSSKATAVAATTGSATTAAPNEKKFPIVPLIVGIGALICLGLLIVFWVCKSKKTGTNNKRAAADTANTVEMQNTGIYKQFDTKETLYQPIEVPNAAKDYNDAIFDQLDSDSGPTK